MSTSTSIFGIRHHGPGSARSLKAALDKLQPDCVFIEGPADASPLISAASDPRMKPPVALLVYAVDNPKHAAFYPFAVFSPEWQAIQYAVKAGAIVRFMDLPMALWLQKNETEKLESDTPAGQEQTAEENVDPVSVIEPTTEVAPNLAFPVPATVDPEVARRDPLQYLAEAAGYADGELWWDQVVEHRRDGEGVFAAVLEAMTVLRETHPHPKDVWEDRREAHMRQTIRSAQKEGFERIAVICGAWHAPVLVPEKMPSAKDDVAILKDLPKVKTAATWVPWSYGRLSFASGYGAGITSPGWYHHLWSNETDIATRWMTKVARLLRGEDLDASSAHIIEAVRLAEALAALRNRSVVSLDELNAATRAVLCFADATPLDLIHQKLIVAETLGEVPPDGPAAPLQVDLQRQQKRLRMPADAGAKSYELDLRKPNDLERSQLLHRLLLLGIPWGENRHTGRVGGAKGTFKEVWQVQWMPEYAIRLIEAGTYGNSIYDASTGLTRRTVMAAHELPPVTELLDRAIQAALPEAVSFLMKRIETLAAVASDLKHMMAAVPALANVVRYGNVRQTDTAMVGQVVNGLITRIVIGLPGACASLDDTAAMEMDGAVRGVHEAVTLLQNPEQLADWIAALRSLADQAGLHGLLAGRCTRLLLDGGHIDSDDAARRMSLALSIGSNPPFAAAWVEGFLKGSGLVLLHDSKLWSVLDEWVATLDADKFTETLPLLRRSFSQFPAPERRQMGQQVKKGMQVASTGGSAQVDLDVERAARVIPTLARILGLPVTTEGAP